MAARPTSTLPRAALRVPPRGAAPLTAYVLHRYNWSESSLVLDLFTRERGRIAVVAKGAKRPYSQQRAVLLPFQNIAVTLGRTVRDEAADEVQNLRGAEWAGGAAMLTGAALFSGFYLNELLMKLLARQDPQPRLFDVYAQTLPALTGRDDSRVEAALRAFELVLLRELGVLPDLSLVTLTQQTVQSEWLYALQGDVGVVDGASKGSGNGNGNGNGNSNGNSSGRMGSSGRRDADAPGPGAVLTGTALIGLEAALQHGSVAALQQACAGSLPALKVLLRGLIQHQLGSATLRTRQVMLELQALHVVPELPA